MSALDDLLAVQDLDLAMDQLHHRRDHLPERSELAGIDARAGELLREQRDVEQSRTAVGEREAEAEAELAATESRSASVGRRLYSGEVSASRDLQALAAELDQLKGRASQLEDSILEMLEEREPLEQRASELERTLKELGERRRAVIALIGEQEKALDAELGDLVSRRAEAAAVVPANLMGTYERLRGRLGGVGVARLVGNHCDGCHLTLSAMELDRVKHLPDGEVFTCEQCSRILVPSG